MNRRELRQLRLQGPGIGDKARIKMPKDIGPIEAAYAGVYAGRHLFVGGIAANPNGWEVPPDRYILVDDQTTALNRYKGIGSYCGIYRREDLEIVERWTGAR